MHLTGLKLLGFEVNVLTDKDLDQGLTFSSKETSGLHLQLNLNIKWSILVFLVLLHINIVMNRSLTK